MLLHVDGKLPFVDGAARCLKSILTNNETLCVRFAPILTDVVRRLAKRGARSTDLLGLLQTMLVSDGKTITQSQIAVCKGAIRSEELIVHTGALDELELDRKGVLIKGLLSSQDGQADRCREHLRYYCQCLQLLGITARGKMPTTELLCASLLPFDVMINRAFEVFDEKLVPQGLSVNDAAIDVKRATILFFREVFVDTNSDHIIRSLRQGRNGVWR